MLNIVCAWHSVWLCVACFWRKRSPRDVVTRVRPQRCRPCTLPFTWNRSLGLMMTEWDTASFWVLFLQATTYWNHAIALPRQRLSVFDADTCRCSALFSNNMARKFNSTFSYIKNVLSFNKVEFVKYVHIYISVCGWDWWHIRQHMLCLMLGYSDQIWQHKKKQYH